MSDKVQFDLGSEFEDSNYKSCFARSVAVNSQYKQSKSLDMTPKQLPKERFSNIVNNSQSAQLKRGTATEPFLLESPDVVRLRKNVRTSSRDDSRRFSCSSVVASRRSSFCTSRITEIPVENIVSQSKIETLQWQLKEIEKSREMYRAVMNQVVSFLEKTHHSLELLGKRLNTKKTVPRSKSEHQIISDDSPSKDNTLTSGISSVDDYMALRDFSWRCQKKPEASPDEIPPEKLAKEAFRLLRTTQSLLSTQEPDLVQINNDPVNDIEFLATLAKEFPQTPEHKPLRTTSFSVSPKLILPDSDSKLSVALNRKLSLQLSDTRRNSTPKLIKNFDSARGSVAESEVDLLSSTLNDFNKDHRSSISSQLFSHQKSKNKESDKSKSPATGSISSVEDESGFSSMNSFQDVGLPIVNSTTYDVDVSTKNALLRSMLHNGTDYNSLGLNFDTNSSFESTVLPNTTPQKEERDKRLNLDEIKLWQKPDNVVHKRWHSTPVDDAGSNPNQSVKVLWV